MGDCNKLAWFVFACLMLLSSVGPLVRAQHAPTRTQHVILSTNSLATDENRGESLDENVGANALIILSSSDVESMRRSSRDIGAGK